MTPKLGSLSNSNSSSSSAREKRKTSAPESMRQGLPKRANRNAESSQGQHVVYQVDSDSDGSSPKPSSYTQVPGMRSHVWTPPVCQAPRIVDGGKEIAAMYPDFIRAHARGP
ncbi:hypothetical protein ACQUJT_16275, partial [Ralstonia pseudosolanacearum]